MSFMNRKNGAFLLIDYYLEEKLNKTTGYAKVWVGKECFFVKFLLKRKKNNLLKTLNVKFLG